MHPSLECFHEEVRRIHGEVFWHRESRNTERVAMYQCYDGTEFLFQRRDSRTGNLPGQRAAHVMEHIASTCYILWAFLRKHV